MAIEKKISWSIGEVFAVRLIDRSYAFGQIVDVAIPNTASCAFFDCHSNDSSPPESNEIVKENVIATATVVASHLDRGAWKTVQRV